MLYHSSKPCIHCDVDKPLSEFYTHSQMADGHINVCKSCKIEYQKKRSRTPEGIEVQRRRNKKRQKALTARSVEWRKKNPDGYKAHNAANNGLRDGKLERKSNCEDCDRDGDLHKHHDDYNNPLEVTWLCPGCHSKRSPQYLG